MRNNSVVLWSALFSAIFALCSAVRVSAAGANYKIVQTYHVGGDGGWDYLLADSATHRVYISRATHVIVLDSESGNVAGDIPDTPGVHGITLAPELGHGFISNGRENTVTVFELTSLKPITKINVGQNPDAILYDSSSKRVFTFNGKSQDATVIDASTNKVLGTIKLDGKPEFAADDGKGGLFVNIEDKSELVSLDPVKMSIKATWSLAPCEEPSGLAIDREHRRLFAGCDNKMMAVVNADTGKVVATPAIGEGVDATAFDPGSGLAFASCGEDGVLSIIHEDSPDTYSVVQTLATQKGARTLALDDQSHKVFLVTAKMGKAPAPTPQNPHPHVILPDTFVVLVAGQ